MPDAFRAGSRPRRLFTLALLALASLMLHALLIRGAAHQAWPWQAVRGQGSSAPPVEVVLLPARPTPPATQAAPPAPRSGLSSPQSRPRPSAARKPASAALVPAEPSAPTPMTRLESQAVGEASEADADPADASAAGQGEPVATVPRTDSVPVSEPADVGAVPAEAAQATPAPPPAEVVVNLPPLPASRQGRFRIFWGDYQDGQSVARMNYTLQVNQDRYLIRTEGQAEGLISLVYAGTLTQSSEGRQSAAGLEPLRYVETRGRGAQRIVAFDPEGRRLLPTDAEPVPIPAGTQDRLSVFYQLGLMARADPGAFVAGRVIDIPVATMRAVRPERFAVMGEELLNLPGGPVRALHLQRPAPPGTRDPLIDLWLGIEQDMLPVRLRIEDGSRRVLDQIIDTAG